MRAPNGAAYEIVTVEGKGRGIIASRDINKGEIVLRESPILVMPPGDEGMAAPLLLALPENALEAILLHNALPHETPFTGRRDIPHHRRIDTLTGIINSNSFGATHSFCKMGVLLLTGSPFNHDNKNNVDRRFDAQRGTDGFIALRDIKKGEELLISYTKDPVMLAEYVI